MASRSLPLLSPPIGPADSMGRAMARYGPAAAMALGFFCFLPYPAIAVGHASNLQIGNILSMMLLVPAIALPWRHRPVYFFPLILAPMVLSSVKAGLAGTDDLDLCIKDISIMAMACLTMVIVQLYAPRYGLQLLTGIAAVTVVHALVGLWQVYCFSFNEFPFVDLYVNQSFSGVQDNTEVIARYIQRPFGIFPEPSAMASSLAPWIIFLFAELCGVVRLRQQPARWQRILFAAAAAGGITLIILSASGHTMITLAALMIIGVLGLRKLRATPRNLAIVLPSVGILLPLVLWGALTIMSNRIDSEYQVKGSWDERSSSLIVGYAVYARGDLATILFGIGAGLSPGAVFTAGRLEAVFSVLLSYIYETGLFGAIAVCLIGAYLLRVWRASKLNPAFAIIAVVWLVGITLTTSFAVLLPIWVALGWLTVWPAICAPIDPPLPHKRSLEIQAGDASIQPRPLTWTAPQNVPGNE